MAGDLSDSRTTPPGAAGGVLRRQRRQYHTRVGWWLMTHDRGGVVVIGTGAIVVLGADLAYAVTRWSASFARSFSFASAVLLVAVVAGLLLRLGGSIGPDRATARRRQRTNNLLLDVLCGAAVVTCMIGAVFGNFAGEILGLVAVVAGLFAVAALAALVRSATH